MEGLDHSFESLEIQSFKSNIAKDVILVFLTCGLYGLFWQHRQMKFINFLSKERKFSFAKWAIFTILTCGIYHFYHEYLMGCEILFLQEKTGATKNESLPITSLVLSLISLGIITDAIQQNEINKLVDETVKK